MTSIPPAVLKNTTQKVAKWMDENRKLRMKRKLWLRQWCRCLLWIWIANQKVSQSHPSTNASSRHLQMMEASVSILFRSRRRRSLAQVPSQPTFYRLICTRRQMQLCRSKLSQVYFLLLLAVLDEPDQIWQYSKSLRCSNNTDWLVNRTFL